MDGSSYRPLSFATLLAILLATFAATLVVLGLFALPERIERLEQLQRAADRIERLEQLQRAADRIEPNATLEIPQRTEGR